MTVLFHKGQQGFDGFQGQAYRMAVAEKDLFGGVQDEAETSRG